ncbi:MAG: hypothetical protein E6G35_00755 [Actinobacteria bacterium]|nr:MAG: hypothetical protein E6G35_00755 [Actinomycetota bacterium]
MGRGAGVVVTGLPPVVAPVLAAAVDALPSRLRRKLDDTVAAAASWPVSVHNGQTTVTVDDSTTVTVSAPDGTVTEPGQVTCTCLLAPNCLHRAAVLARAPVADPVAVADAGPADPTGPAVEEEPERLTEAQRAAAEQLWQAGTAVLGAGVSGTGVVLRTALLRATHEARVHGLHRAAAAGRAIAAHLHAARELQPQYRLADLTDQVRELLTVTRKLGDPDLPPDRVPGLVGTARRRYDLHGSLRLYGLCTVPVVAETGYAGVVTYLVDRDARLWTVADLMPGGEERALAAAEATVALGEAALSPRRPRHRRRLDRGTAVPAVGGADRRPGTPGVRRARAPGDRPSGRSRSAVPVRPVGRGTRRGTPRHARRCRPAADRRVRPRDPAVPGESHPAGRSGRPRRATGRAAGPGAPPGRTPAGTCGRGPGAARGLGRPPGSGVGSLAAQALRGRAGRRAAGRGAAGAGR